MSDMTRSIDNDRVKERVINLFAVVAVKAIKRAFAVDAMTKSFFRHIVKPLNT